MASISSASCAISNLCKRSGVDVRFDELISSPHIVVVVEAGVIPLPTGGDDE